MIRFAFFKRMTLIDDMLIYTPKRPKLKSGAGFTLMELLIVIGIMSVLILMAVPQYALLKNSVTLTDQAQEIADALRTAQSRAITSQDGVAHSVHFEASQYTIYFGSDWASRNPIHDAQYQLGTGLQISNSFNVQCSGSTDITFVRLSGRTSEKHICVGHPGGDYKDVQVDSEGRISIL